LGIFWLIGLFFRFVDLSIVLKSRLQSVLAEKKGFSVVISTYSKEKKDQVLDCIGSLHRQSLLPNEILLVLDRDPGLVEYFKDVVPPDVRIISSDGFGLSFARNAGVEHSNSEVVAFIDDDAIADKDWLKNMFVSYSDPSVVGVGGFVNPLWSDRRPSWWFPEELNWTIGCSYAGRSNRREVIRNPIGCNMSFRQSIFKAVGYFRHDVGRLGKVLLDGEEPEFSNRVYQKFPGAKIINEPTAVVHHRVSGKRMRFKYVLKRAFYQGFSKALIYKTYKKDSMVLEHDYLHYLMTSSLKNRFRWFYSPKNLVQIATLFIASMFVFVGFAVGKLRRAVD
jgi:glycosyltransferase involved in cell wall biosynthesis